ncbi:hypothetical protein HPB48_019309 [Haemaphysalis longicornis]|uniref:YqaJ viral recombinase domain-containing protein n=1 Tax=Haemaphysalis longicornis TaxID=44386 RepID=A0A9J6FB63_HAELO|nr:hypothetical protein HPB48_019309 [Haemaphysalis longicornis]
MPPALRVEALDAAYRAQLIGSARARYEKKLRMCDSVDPYTLRPGLNTVTDIAEFPEVTHGDIVKYFVYTSSFVTLEEMKAYKSMEAHNYLTCGWVKSLSAKRLRGDKVLVVGEHIKRASPQAASTLTQLFCEETQQDSLDVLIEKGDNFVLSFEVSETTAKKVEAATKDQSWSPQWFLHRARRVTASVIRSVCTTSIDKPSLSLVKKVCYPQKEKLAVPAVMWGVKHEIDAFRAYEAHERPKYIDFTCTRSGLHLSLAYPSVGATPDAIVSCACCGKGVVEFKCPFLLKDRPRL